MVEQQFDLRYVPVFRGGDGDRPKKPPRRGARRRGGTGPSGLGWIEKLRDEISQQPWREIRARIDRKTGVIYL
jgi:hypothetical protein